VQNEASLVQRAQQRDQEALTQLYEANFDKIYRYVAFKMGDRVEAEDITQQVFINAIESISRFKWQGTSFSAWLYRIAHNQIVDYLRRKSKRPMVPLEKAATRSSDSNPTETAELNLDIAQVAEATKKLTKAQREVISLRFTSELSITEVARIMGKSEGAIKALQHAAIVSLRRILAVE
jgi:RNA polymerase sigma-70 factor (ECF subfamily)